MVHDTFHKMDQVKMTGGETTKLKLKCPLTFLVKYSGKHTHTHTFNRASNSSFPGILNIFIHRLIAYAICITYCTFVSKNPKMLLKFEASQA